MWLGVYTKGAAYLTCFVSPCFIAYSYWPLLGTYNWVEWFWTDAEWRSSADTSVPQILAPAVLAVPTFLSISCSQELLYLQCWKNPQNLTDSNSILYLDFLKANFYILYTLGTVCIADELSQVIKTFCDILHSAAGNPVLKWEVWEKKKQISNNCFRYALAFSLKIVGDISACLATLMLSQNQTAFSVVFLDCFTELCLTDFT